MPDDEKTPFMNNKYFTYLILAILAYAVLSNYVDRKNLNSIPPPTAATINQKRSLIQADLNQNNDNFLSNTLGQIVRPVIEQRIDQELARKGIDKATLIAQANAPTIVDTLKGTGNNALCGHTATIHYTATLENGSIITQATKDNPLTFRIGDNRVIKGLQQGIIGMKTGGKRTLTIPANLAFDDPEFTNTTVPAGAKVIYNITLETLTPNTSPNLETVQQFNKSSGTGNPLRCGNNGTFNYTIRKVDSTIVASGKDLLLTPGKGETFVALEQRSLDMLESGKRTLIIPPEHLKPWNTHPNANQFPLNDLKLPANQAVIIELELLTVN